MSVNSQTNRHPGLRFGAKVRRQDKSADRRRAHVVGWVGFFDTSPIRACWRFSPIHQRFQCPDRHPRSEGILLD
jgi:hypothetical protein